MTHPHPLKMALIGGGGAGFIGRVHVTAATLDRQAQLVAGAFRSDPSQSQVAAADFGVDPERSYSDYQTLLATEAQRPSAERVDFVSIATPNFTHYEIACAALEAGFHVVCDKPMTIDSESAAKMQTAVEQNKKVFLLTHNYSGYPMVRQAREMIASGELGEILAVRVSYVQGWMHGMDGDAPQDRGAWKSDPQRNGKAGALGDVGTHAFQLLQFTTGLTPTAVLSRMSSYAQHHQLDDYGHAMLQLPGEATGLVTWSQVSHGRQNDLSIEIDGTKAALSWRQEDPNCLVVRSLGKPTQVFDRAPGSAYMTPAATAASRLPGGHPEAFFEAFANLYRDAFADMRLVNSGQSPNSHSIYPSVEDGVQGVHFMNLCLNSHESGSTWQAW